ncbi:hypothetical protein EBU95_18080, partial [bacterium]|nr:hypothetical protein [bacterium]
TETPYYPSSTTETPYYPSSTTETPYYPSSTTETPYHPSSSSSTFTPANVYLAEPWHFYSNHSTGGIKGRDDLGNLYNENKIIIEKGLCVERNLEGKNDLQKYLLTYSAGHPYYTQPGYGQLYGKKWHDHVQKYGIPLEENGISSDPDKVLVVEDGNVPIFLGLSSSYRFKGIVVRHGGILWIDDLPSQTIKIEIEFILIESGGLLQAGSKYKQGFRYQNHLNIIFTNPPEGLINMGNISSQYSYMVYFPGVVKEENKQLMTPYFGDPEAFRNTFGPKVLAVGFNGNIDLSAEIPDLLMYQGIWNAFLKQQDGSLQNFIDSSTYLTIPSNESVSSLVNVELNYPNVWCRLQNGIYKTGDNFIIVDPRDRKGLNNWNIGDEVVITCTTDEYINSNDLLGMVPIWLNHPKNSSDYQKNLEANQIFQTQYLKNHPTQGTNMPGVEVATISTIDIHNGKITLEQPLFFYHESLQTSITNIKGQTIIVDTLLHVALLTRKIKIISAFQNPPLDQPDNDRRCNITRDELPSDSIGVKGPTWCNFINPNVQDEVYNTCYKPRDEGTLDAWTTYCGPEKPKAPENGHWIFGTTDILKCNSILGGSTMFMNGSSVNMDGVELKYMGTPANFGSIARYSIHFHMSGFTKSYVNYLPSTEYPRSASIQNCSIWCTFSRWIVVHGTHETNIKNNIGFISYGSGYFTEDGTETQNTFEHNMSICCLNAHENDYWNPLPIYPNVSSDIAVASAFWMKNNQNRCFRNVCCNSPSPIIGFWAVPQKIPQLRGPSTVCLGDPTLELCGLATWSNSQGSSFCYLSQDQNTNDPNNPDRIFQTKYGFPDNITTLCWMPSYMIDKGLGGKTQKCGNFSEDNSTNPYLCWSENIVYCMASGFSEFPEVITTETGGYYGCGNLPESCSYNIDAFPSSPKPQFIPGNGQNTCTDNPGVAGGTYFETMWGGGNNTLISQDYFFQPLTQDQISIFHDGDQKACGVDFDTMIIPKIFSHWLTWNVGPSRNGLFGGAGWTKSAPTWLLNCCFLQNGGGTAANNTACNESSCSISNSNCTFNSGAFSRSSSSVWSMTCGDARQFYTNSYFVMYNIISNGAIGMPSAVTLLGGPLTFFDTNSIVYSPMEYNSGFDCVNRFYLFDGMNFDTIFHDNFLQTFFNALAPNCPNLEIYEMSSTTQEPSIVTFAYCNSLRTCSKGTYNSLNNQSSVKYPFICNPQGKLFKISESSQAFVQQTNPQWLDIVANAPTALFLNDTAFQLGDKLCSHLSIIPGCMCPYYNISDNFNPFCGQSVSKGPCPINIPM